MERSGVLPTTPFAYRKGLGTCDALLCVFHTVQSTLESGQESSIVLIDFNAAFDRGQPSCNSLKALFCGYWRLCVVKSATQKQFLSNRPQHGTVDGCQSKQVNDVSGVPQGSVFLARYCSSYTP